VIQTCQTYKWTRFFFMACFLWMMVWPGALANAGENPPDWAPLTPDIGGPAHSQGSLTPAIQMEKKGSDARADMDPFASPLNENRPDQRAAQTSPPSGERPGKASPKHQSPNKKGRLGQFRLTGLLTRSEGSVNEKIAMVEDASGEGHMLRKGDAIGPGRVIDILSDRIIIGIKIKDGSGKTRVEKTEWVPTLFSGEKISGEKKSDTIK